MLALKLSDEQCAALGIKTQEEFLRAWDGLQKDSKENQTLTGRVDVISKDVSRLEILFNATATRTGERLAALEEAPEVLQHIDTKLIETIAETRASAMVVQALGAVGINAVAGAPVNPALVLANPAKEAEAKGDFKAQWAADAKLQGDFLTAESYDAFRRAEKRGAIKIVQRN